MKQPKIIKKEHVLCRFCNKPIHIDDLGGIDKKGFFHSDIICLIGLAKILE